MKTLIFLMFAVITFMMWPRLQALPYRFDSTSDHSLDGSYVGEFGWQRATLEITGDAGVMRVSNTGLGEIRGTFFTIIRGDDGTFLCTNGQCFEIKIKPDAFHGAGMSALLISFKKV